MGKISKVGKLSIGDSFWDEGFEYQITSFPTRTSVCGDAVDLQSGQPGNVKLSISKIKTAPPFTGKEKYLLGELFDELLRDPFLCVTDIKKRMKEWVDILWMDPEGVIKTMSKTSGFTYNEILNSQERIVADARYCCFYYFWKKGATSTAIASFFGKCNHTTVLHGLKQFNDRISVKNDRIRIIYNVFTEELNKNA